jgi:hypothetical protein
MGLNRVFVCVAGATALLAGACGSNSSSVDASASIDGAPGDGGVDGGACTKLWTVVPGTGTASVSAGKLILAASNMPQGSAIGVYQAGLTGDFDVQFEVTAFTAGGTGAFVQAVVSDDVASPTRLFTSAIGTFPTVGISAADQPSGSTDVRPTTATAATLRVERNASTGEVTVYASTGSDTASITGTFANDPLRIGIQLGSNNGTVAGDSRAEIDTFAKVGGGTIQNDLFNCDSLN